MVILGKVLRAPAHQRLHHFFIGVSGGEKEIRILPAPHIDGLSPVDPVGVHDNPAALCLPENPGQPDHRNPPRGNDILQHVSRAHAGQLVRVSHQDERHGIRQGLQEIVHEHDIYHGALVQNQHVALQRIFPVLLIALRRLVFQQPVNGLRFHPGGLGHPFRRPSRGRSQQHPAARQLISGNDAFYRGGLSRARPAGQRHDLRGDCRADRLQLYLVIGNPGTLPNLPQNPVRVQLHRALCQKQAGQPPGAARLREIKGRKVNRLLVLDDILSPQHLVQGHLKLRRLHLQKLLGFANQLLPERIAVSFFRKLVQRVQDSASQPHKFLFADSQLFRDLVGCLEADAPDIIRQPVGIFLDNADTVAAVGLKNLRGVGGADLMALEKKHDILDLLLLLPALFDALHPNLPDALHLQQRIRMLLYHVQRIFAEFLDDALREFRPHALYQTGA